MEHDENHHDPGSGLSQRDYCQIEALQASQVSIPWVELCQIRDALTAYESLAAVILKRPEYEQRFFFLGSNVTLSTLKYWARKLPDCFASIDCNMTKQQRDGHDEGWHDVDLDELADEVFPDELVA